MIKISALTFDYPGHRALHQVSLQVEAGVTGMDVLERPREVHRIMGYLSDFYGLSLKNPSYCFTSP